MDVRDYLARIGWRGDARPDLETLRALHRAHLLAIPYENLDVQFGRHVTIERPAIFDKVVARRRGGWCYEMNGMFGWALAELGFKVTRGAGAAMREMFGDSAIGNHLVLRVDLEEGTYLADVGFGDGPRDPIRVAPGDFHSHGFPFGLSNLDGKWWRLRNHPLAGAPSFDFTLDAADEGLLAEKCVFLQTDPQSVFVQNLVSQRHTPEGLTILRGRVLRHIAASGVTKERILSGPDDLVSTLAHAFDLDMPEAATLWPKVAARHEQLFAEKTGS